MLSPRAVQFQQEIEEFLHRLHTGRSRRRSMTVNSAIAGLVAEGVLGASLRWSVFKAIQKPMLSKF